MTPEGFTFVFEQTKSAEPTLSDVLVGKDQQRPAINSTLNNIVAQEEESVKSEFEDDSTSFSLSDEPTKDAVKENKELKRLVADLQEQFVLTKGSGNILLTEEAEQEIRNKKAA